ncbi:molybdenum cofactor guanylyltransferase [Bacillus sp. 1NLA3E]|jgi:molybdopterin-guanine dinucleotide biosynthesis protein A|uniref:molybdenum cofactor guanylyltransferase n=1 Tax=Bacillus sp. 1NLA3E TaxID=666686 RepID=UPI000247EF9E|nr:molybdenum cofactor guanylyltransferase [Bacillus sp. 1NLA3E]
MKAGGIILSGGKSSRMGTNKAFLKINQKPNIERVKNELEKLVDDIILVSNDPEEYQFLNIKTVTDDFPGKGPLAGIHAGLKASSSQANLVVACDMPFVSAKLGSILLNQASDYDAVIPVINGRQQMLFAVYQKGILEEIEKCIEGNNLSIKHVLDSFNVCYLTEEELHDYSSGSLNRIFFNMNSPEEYEHAKKWAETEE